MQETEETKVQSLGWEDALKEEMANHSNILAYGQNSHGQRSLADYVHWVAESDMTEVI